MKKLIIVLIALLTVSGCSQAVSSDAKISAEKEEVYFKYDGKNYTNNDAFQRLKAQQVGTYFDYIIANKAVEIEGIEHTITAEEIESSYQQMVDMYGAEMVEAYYGDLESYVKQSLISDSYLAYQMNYVKENIDKFITDYPTLKVEYITSTNKTKMNTFLKTIKKDKTKDFDKAYEKAKFEENESVAKQIVEVNNTALPTEVLDALNALENGAVSDLIEISNSTDETTEAEETITYYIVKLVGKDAKADYQEEFIDYTVNNGYVPTPTVIAKEKHELVMYDDDFNNTYETMMAQFSTESDAQ